MVIMAVATPKRKDSSVPFNNHIYGVGICNQKSVVVVLVDKK